MSDKKAWLPYLVVGIIVFLNFGLNDRVLLPLILFAVVFAAVYLIQTHKEHCLVQRLLDLF